MDDIFPKGVPVGIVTRVMPGNETLFQQVQAEPLVDLEYLEEVILLQREGSGPPLVERLPYPVESEPLLLPGQGETETLPGMGNGTLPALPAQ